MIIIPEGWALAPCEATEAMTKAATPTLKYSVTAYDEAGYGDDRSRDFPADQEAEATAYAASLEPRFGAHVHRVTRLLPADEIWVAMLASAPPAPGGFSSDVASDGLHRVAQERHTYARPSFSGRFLEKLNEREYRAAYVEMWMRQSLAAQIRALREQRGWTQGEFAERAGKPQSVICRLEGDDHLPSLKTLFEVATALDLPLLVEFATWPEWLTRTRDVAPKDLQRPAFEPFSESPAEGLGTDGGETAKRREEPLTPSPSLADKGLLEACRFLLTSVQRKEGHEPPWYFVKPGSGPEHSAALTLIANALEARAARALSGEGRAG